MTSLLIAMPAVAEKPQIEGIAPDFVLPGNLKYNQRLSEQKGKVVVLVFWGSWCGHCAEPLRKISQWQQQYEDQGVEFWGINLDRRRDEAMDFYQHQNIKIPVLYDTTLEVSQLYDPVELPSFVIVDRDGLVHTLHDGFDAGSTETLTTALDKLVGK